MRNDHLNGAACNLLAGILVICLALYYHNPVASLLAWFPLRWACVRVVRAVEAGRTLPAADPDDFGQHDA